MESPKHRSRRWQTVATVCMGLGVLLILIGNAVDRQWPTVGVLAVLLGALLTILLLQFAHRDRD